MSMSYLSPSCRRGADIDVVKVFTKFIVSNYGNEIAEKNKHCIEEFQNLRQKVLSKLFDRHESSLDLLNMYYDQLLSAETRIPMTENEIRVEFKWWDSFEKSMTKIPSSSFEKISILFNIACVHSQIAADNLKSSTDDQTLKNAAKYFQQSAGLFTHLRLLVPTLPLKNPGVDFNGDFLSSLSNLMLAQAQESIYVKAVKSRMANAIIAKIAQQCSDFYTEVKIQSVKNMFPKDWVNLVQCKQTSFQSFANYYQGLAVFDIGKYGECIARYKVADSLIKAAQGKVSANQFPYEQYIGIIKSALSDVERENNLIYHDTVPDARNLPSVEKAVLAKELVPQFPLSGANFKDLFEGIVPVAHMNACQSFESSLLQHINYEKCRLREANDLSTTLMASMNLPAVLEDHKDAGDIPPLILEKSLQIKQDGGSQKMRESINSLFDMEKTVQEILDESVRLLDEEKLSDDNLRQQFGSDKWTRSPSDKLTESWRVEIGKFKTLIEQAVNGDSVIRNKFQSHEKVFNILSGSDSEIRKTIQESKGQAFNAQLANDSQMKARDSLKILCNDMENLKVSRRKLEEDLGNVKNQLPITELIKRLQQENGLTDCVNSLMAPNREKVTASIKNQEELFSKIQSENVKFCGGVGSNNSDNTARTHLLTDLSSAHDHYLQLSDNLKQGEKFYSDMTDILLKFQSKVQDFCFARKTEKEELMRDMQSNIVRDTSSSAPPPRPPQPTRTENKPSEQETKPTMESAPPPAESAPPAPYPYAMPNQPSPFPTFFPNMGYPPMPYPMPHSFPYAPGQGAGAPPPPPGYPGYYGYPPYGPGGSYGYPPNPNP